MDRTEQEEQNVETTAESRWLSFRHSPIHGTGAFACVDIPSGTIVIEYVGEVISKQESLKRCEADNAYIFGLDSDRDIDGNVPWNPARFINHSCAPNCDAELHSGRILILARREIAAGEEVTFNYGYDLTDYKDYPCQCGAPHCVGFIVAEDFFPHVRKQREPAREPE